MGLGEEGRKAPEVSATGRSRVGKMGWKEVEDLWLTWEHCPHLGACLPPALAYPSPTPHALVIDFASYFGEMDIFSVICPLPVPTSFFSLVPFSVTPLSLSPFHFESSIYNRQETASPGSALPLLPSLSPSLHFIFLFLPGIFTVCSRLKFLTS